MTMRCADAMLGSFEGNMRGIYVVTLGFKSSGKWRRAEC